MLTTIRNHLRDNHGDVYIQMIICLTVLLLVSVVVFTVASSLSKKLWLDERMNDISKIVDSTGTTKNEAISDIELSITNRFGGHVRYETNFLDDDPEKGLVQLNEKVKIIYHNDKYTVMSIFGNDISTEINIYKTAVSSVYYKTNNDLID